MQTLLLAALACANALVIYASAVAYDASDSFRYPLRWLSATPPARHLLAWSMVGSMRPAGVLVFVPFAFFLTERNYVVAMTVLPLAGSLSFLLTSIGILCDARLPAYRGRGMSALRLAATYLGLTFCACWSLGLAHFLFVGSAATDAAVVFFVVAAGGAGLLSLAVALNGLQSSVFRSG